MTTTKFELVRNPFGRLVLTTGEGDVHEGVAAVRAFPVQAPEDGIALVSGDGKEVAWIDRIEDLPKEIGDLVREELAGREFMPEISRIVDVSGFCLLYTSPSPRDLSTSRMPSSA